MAMFDMGEEGSRTEIFGLTLQGPQQTLSQDRIPAPALQTCLESFAGFSFPGVEISNFNRIGFLHLSVRELSEQVSALITRNFLKI